MTDFVRG